VETFEYKLHTSAPLSTHNPHLWTTDLASTIMDNMGGSTPSHIVRLKKTLQMVMVQQDISIIDFCTTEVQATGMAMVKDRCGN
jgi:hypothetical protein